MACDISRTLAVYCIGVVFLYLSVWAYLSWKGLRNNRGERYWLFLVISAILVPYVAYLRVFFL
jgi:hypothetical protein